MNRKKGEGMGKMEGVRRGEGKGFSEV